MQSEDGKFEIICHTKDDDSYFYSDTDYSWVIVSTETGDELTAFYGHSCQRRDGNSEAGVENAVFSEDGKKKTWKLPKRGDLVDEGHAILITWQSGRTEKRPLLHEIRSALLRSRAC